MRKLAHAGKMMVLIRTKIKVKWGDSFFEIVTWIIFLILIFIVVYLGSFLFKHI